MIQALASRGDLIPEGLLKKNFSLLFGHGDIDMKRMPVFMASRKHYIEFMSLTVNLVCQAGTGLMAGTSTRNMLHHCQGICTGKLRKYDYESEELNKKNYGTPTPPEYPLENISNRYMCYIWSNRDWFCDPQDIEEVKKRLRVPLYDDYEVPKAEFNHLGRH